MHPIAGKPLVQHVWERCLSCNHLDDVIIATDDERIHQAATEFGAKACMTSPDHPSGTDRIAEVARSFPNHGAIVNIQGDEPLIDPALIDELARILIENPDLEMVTAANPIDDPELIADSNVVKVVLDSSNRALYFSRSGIPFVRNAGIDGFTAYRHKGIYGYRREFVLQFVEWAPSPLEQTEGLEQLRALENGARIQVAITNDESPGVDTPEQARIVAAMLEHTR